MHMQDQLELEFSSAIVGGGDISRAEEHGGGDIGRAGELFKCTVPRD